MRYRVSVEAIDRLPGSKKISFVRMPDASIVESIKPLKTEYRR